MKIRKFFGAACISILTLSVIIPAVSGRLGADTANTLKGLLLVENGRSLAPVILFKDAPPSTRQAAEDLVDYMEKITGARPELLEGTPDPVPESAIWVGYQPKLASVFPGIDFDFKHPEEILIAANDRHLVIAGRDRWDPLRIEPIPSKRGFSSYGQQEYGTANAVYTFLQDYLGVRWLWQGKTGEDILPQKTIAFPPFEYRYNPKIRLRSYIMFWWPRADDRGKNSITWARHQRLLLDSSNLQEAPDGHAFMDWWERFGQSHPEYFALQPDGTRGPTSEMGGLKVKLCDSNPAVWEQWLKDVEAQLEKNPTQTLFRGGVNDGNLSGFCVCEDCRAWDSPEAEKRLLVWDGISQDHVALSDRHVMLANKLAAKLRERFPGKDYKVMMLAYGPSLPGPLKTKPDSDVLVLHVSNWFDDLKASDPRSTTGKTWPGEYAEWAAAGANLWWRPNIPNNAGMYFGMPDVPFGRVIDTMKFLQKNNTTGLAPAAFWNFWPTQGPLYYLIAQLAWNPDADGRAILADYYERGFGPAAPKIKEYWTLMEDTRNRKVDGNHAYWEAYDQSFFDQAQGLLDGARKAVEGDREVYGARLDHLQTGLDFTRLLVETARLKEDYKLNEKNRPKTGPLLLEKYKIIKSMSRGDEEHLLGPAHFLDKWLAEPKELHSKK